MNIGFPLDDDTPRADPPRNFPCEVDRRRIVAMQIASESALNQSAPTDHTAATQIAFAREMYVPSCPNRAAETAGDFVVAQINVRAARRANCGSGGATNLLFPLTFETLDNRAVLPFPKILKFAEDGRGGWRSRRFFANP